MTKLIPQDYQQTNDNKGSRKKTTPQDLASGTYFGQMQLRGSILVIKDNSTTASGFISYGTSMSTIPTTSASGTGVYQDYSGIYGNLSGVPQFYLQASDGKAYAGAGAVTLDSGGITIAAGNGTANNLTWKSGATSLVTYGVLADTAAPIHTINVVGSAEVDYVVVSSGNSATFTFGLYEKASSNKSYGYLVGTSSSGAFQGLLIGGTAKAEPSSLLHLKSTAPTFRMEDTTASAKSLLVTTDANKTKFEEAGGAANNLFVLDLANARVGIGTASPLAPLHVGSGSVNNSTDAMILISRSVSSGTQNSHAFSDSTNFSNTPYAYNSFDARINITGTGALDHYAGFQVGAEYNNSNTLGAFYGFFSRPTMTQGTITALYHNYAGDPTYAAGTITTQYGLYVENLTRGTTNYAIYTAGTTASLFGGAVTINGNPIVGATGTSPSLTVGNQTSNSTASSLIQKGKSSGGTALSATWDLTTGGLYNLSTQSVSNVLSFNTVNGDITFAEAVDFVLGTSTGTKIGTATTQKIGFWNATPIVQPSAYTQTYSTANKTLNADGVTDPAAYGAGANGYSTGAMAAAVHAAVIALHADLLDTKQMLNSVIDDLQAIGLLS